MRLNCRLWKNFTKHTLSTEILRWKENDTFTWTWYYAMQHMGDLESAKSSEQYTEKMQKRNQAATSLGYFLPNLHTQLVTSHLAKTDMSNHLQYASSSGNSMKKTSVLLPSYFLRKKCRICRLDTASYRSIQLY